MKKTFLAVAAGLVLAVAAPAQNLTVNASCVVRTIDPRIYGMNVSCDDSQLAQPATLMALSALQTQALRYPEGADSDNYNWQSNEDIINFQGNGTWPYYWQGGDPGSFAILAENLGVGGNACIGVNYGSGTPEQAAAWVAYYNGDPSSTTPIGNGPDALGRTWYTAGYWASIRAAAMPMAPDDGYNFLRINHPAAFGFKYWEVGNEIYDFYAPYDQHGIPGSKLSGYPNDPYTYAVNFQAFYNAMKAVDPTIKVGINCVSGEDPLSANPNKYANPTPTGVQNLNDLTTHTGWTPVVLATLNSLPGPVLPDFISDHIYPQEPLAAQAPMAENDAWLLANGGSFIISENTSFQSMIADYLGPAGAHIELEATELNSVQYDQGKQTVSLVNALFMADAIGQLASTTFNACFWWDFRDGTQTGYNNSSSLYGWRQFGDYGILASGDDTITPTPINTAYPTYFAALLLTHWGRGGDQVVAAGSDNPALLSVYAALLANGNLALLVVNKDTMQHSPQITLSGFTPASTATYYSFDENNDAQNVETPYNTPTPLNTGSSSLTFDSGEFSYTFPPYSMTVLVLAAAVPSIQSITPTIGTDQAGQPIVSNGQTVNINGQNLSGVTSVTFQGTGFNGTSPLSAPFSLGSFTVVSSSLITAVIPSSLVGRGTITVTPPVSPAAASGSIEIVSASAPTTPSIPKVGFDFEDFNITGQNFYGATSVVFNGTGEFVGTTRPLSFTVDSPTHITADFPFLIANGTITVTTPTGKAASTSSMMVGDIYFHPFRWPSFYWLGLAASRDGNKLVILSSRGQIYTSADAGMSLVTTLAPIANWTTVASSSDGNTLAAGSSVLSGATATGGASGDIYFSTDEGATWKSSGAPTNLAWVSIAMSTNGTKMAAVGTEAIRGGANQNVVYTSANSGATWTKTIATVETWSQVASSADGTKLVVVSTNGSVLTSANSGHDWSVRSAPTQPWVSVASSADGTKLLAASGGGAPGQIYSSTNGGVSWTLTSAPSLEWINVAISADGTQLAAAGTDPSTLLGSIYTQTNGSAWVSNNLPSGQWSGVVFTGDGNNLIVLGGSQVDTASTAPSPQTGGSQSTAGGAFTRSYTNTFPTGGNTSPFTGGSVASWEYWYGLNFNNTLMTNDPSMDAQGNPNSGSLKVYMPFGSTGDQGVFFGTFGNQNPYDESVTLDASYVMNLAFDIHFAPGTPLDSTGELGSITMSIFPGAENGGDFGLFPSVTIPAAATNGWFHATEVITNFIAQEPLAGLTTCDAMGFNYKSYNGYPASPVTFWIDNVSVLSFQPQVVPTVSWATPSAVTYGTALTATQLDATTSATGTLVYTPPLGTVPGVSTGQVLSVTLNPADSVNYQSITTNVLLQVNPAPLTVTANNTNRAFAAANPAFTASVSGFVNGDSASVVSGFPEFSITATTASAVGTTHPITPSIGSLIASNYTFSKFVNGTLTITAVVTPPVPAEVWVSNNVPIEQFESVASSADGSNLVAVGENIGSLLPEVFTSTNAGVAWSNDTPPSGTFTLSSVASSSDGSKLAAGSSGGPIYISTNAGAAWITTGSPTGWTSIASSSNGNNLVAAGYGALYTSSDGGGTWVSNNLPPVNWTSVGSSANGTNLVAVGSLQATGTGVIYVSANAGANWSLSPAPNLGWTAVASSADGAKLVAGANEGAIYVSTNSGATWSASGSLLYGWSALASSADGTSLVAASDNGQLFTSANSGASWTLTGAPLEPWISVASSSDGTKLVAVATTGRVYTLQIIPPAAPPTLGVSLTGLGGVLISWPRAASGSVLQQNDNLNTTNWVNVTTTPGTNGAMQSILVTPQPGSRFYRLNQ